MFECFLPKLFLYKAISVAKRVMTKSVDNSSFPSCGSNLDSKEDSNGEDIDEEVILKLRDLHRGIGKFSQFTNPNSINGTFSNTFSFHSLHRFFTL